MNEIEHTFEFEELQPVIEGTPVPGMMLYGKAFLVSADPAEKHAFYVKEIRLDGNFRLTQTGAGVMGFPSEFRKVLFKAICDQIEDFRTSLGRVAQDEFSEAVDEGHAADPDRAYDERRDASLEAEQPVRVTVDHVLKESRERQMERV